MAPLRGAAALSSAPSRGGKPGLPTRQCLGAPAPRMVALLNFNPRTVRRSCGRTVVRPYGFLVTFDDPRCPRRPGLSLPRRDRLLYNAAGRGASQRGRPRGERRLVLAAVPEA